MHDFDVEWVLGISNYFVDSLTRDMNKAHINHNIFVLPSKTPEDDNFETFVKIFQILELVLEDVTGEIKKTVGLRLRRNQWIQKFQAWQSKNIGVLLGLDAELVKVYPLPNMKVKLYFKTLDDIWTIEYTEANG